MIGEFYKWLNTQTWWNILSLSVVGVVAVFFGAMTLQLGGLAAQRFLLDVGLIPRDWPIAFTAIPLVLAVAIPMWLLLRRSSWLRAQDTNDPEFPAIFVALAPFIILMFLEYCKGVLGSETLGVFARYGVPAGVWQWAATFGVLIAMFLGAAAIESLIDLVSWSFAKVPERQRREVFSGLWGGLGAVLMFAWWHNWLGATDSNGGALLFGGSVLALAIAVAVLQLPTLRAIASNRRWVTALLAAAFGFCMVSFIGMTAQIVRWGYRSSPIAEGRLLSWVAWGCLPFIVMALLKRWRGAAPSASFEGSVGLSIQNSRNNYPLLSWSQEVGTGESRGQSADRVVRYAMLGMLLGGAVIGFFVGGWQGAAIGAFIGGWFAALAPREAAVPDLRLPIQGSAGTPRAQRPLTDQERQQLAEPVTRREDCEAFLEESGDEIYFCVACGDRSNGALPVVARVPWDSFINFEESSHKQWFRSRGVASDMLDWGVIIAQSNTGRIVRVAESVHDHAGLIELLVKLQNTFVAGREVRLKTFRDVVKARSNVIGSGSSAGHPIEDVPVKPF